ncbi:hypothetical protein [Shinella sp. M27]|uniref:hypothetical protein n=1 Tax=Shinella sp. M27 TaxID=3368614 RepID=UPI003BA278AA
MTGKSSWWSRASTEQKLAQIDGGIECLMSARHIAMNLGAEREEVLSFGAYHGRRFKSRNTVAAARRAGAIGGMVKARQCGKPDYEMVAAFDIFGAGQSERPMFDEVLA